MSPVLHVARAEVLEHRRQPWMLTVLVLGYAVWLVALAAVLFALDSALADPVSAAQLSAQVASMGGDLDTVVLLVISAVAVYLFTNLPLFVAIMSGYSVLHDRSCGAMPFLMLAPLSRRQLLAGKLLGAMAFPMLLHIVFVGLGSLVVVQLDVVAPHADRFGASSAWWVAYLVGGPASAAFVGTVGTLISALSRDVRTSMQFVSFTIGLLSLGIGFCLVDCIPRGVGLQLAFAAACLVLAAVTWFVGARLISRDIEPAP